MPGAWLLPKAPNTGCTRAAFRCQVTITERRRRVNPAVRRNTVYELREERDYFA